MNSRILSFSEVSRCLLVAEIGNNHQGDPELARRCIEAAANAGADMVKFQKRHMPSLFTSQGLARPYSGRNSFGPTYGEHRARLELSVEAMSGLKEYAESLGLEFFASVWDEQSLEDMLAIGVRILKLPSADLINQPLLTRCAAARLPLILSTGMSSMEEIDVAVSTVRKYHDNLLLLHCNSSYPCPPEKIGMPVMNELGRRYGLPVGYSGHETGLGPSVAAVALGAGLVERHFTMDRNLPGSDHPCSLTPEEFTQFSAMARDVEAAMRIKEKQVFPEEQAMALKLRKVLVAARDLPQGHCVDPSDFVLKCAEYLDGSPALTRVELLAGRVLRRALTAEQPAVAEDFVQSECRSALGHDS